MLVPLLLACSPSTPPITDTGAASDIVFNELLADRDAGGDWLELYNVGAAAVALDGYVVTDSTGVAARIPEGLSIAPGGFLAFACGADLAGFDVTLDVSLDKDGDALTLTHPVDGVEVLDDHVAWEQLVGALSAARKPDGGVEWVYDATPTPGESNG